MTKTLEALEQQCAGLADDLAALDRELVTLTDRRRRLQHDLDRASAERERLNPETPLMDSIKAFTSSQHEQRAARVEKAARALGLGITPEVLTGNSPLDAAMARKNRRGVARPTSRQN